MTKQEAQTRSHMLRALNSLGFSSSECQTLRRASMTLHRWHELECGTGDGQRSQSVERDEATGKTCMRIQYPSKAGYVDRKYPTPDRETGAKKRIARAVDACNKARLTHMTDGKMTPQDGLGYFVQTDPRGAALYILRPGDVPQGQDAGAYYSRGICVY